MRKFKLGDKVRLIGGGYPSNYNNNVGTIIEIKFLARLNKPKRLIAVSFKERFSDLLHNF